VNAVRQADIIILAAPVRAIIRLIGDLGAHLPAGALLMDTGSTKSSIMQAMASLPAHVQTIGGHPMCGKERAGLAAADPNLYKGTVFCLTPLERTRPEALSLAGELVRAIGARPLIVEPQRHDALVAAISHLPYLVASALTATAAETAAADPMVWQLAASGFRDTSRLASSDVDMMIDILLTNRAHAAKLARQSAGNLSALAAAIESNDESALRAMLTSAQQTRQQVYH
jgi:prephenate dehydrogenase